MVLARLLLLVQPLRVKGARAKSQSTRRQSHRVPFICLSIQTFQHSKKSFGRAIFQEFVQARFVLPLLLPIRLLCEAGRGVTQCISVADS
jgi:hypothetical protein